MMQGATPMTKRFHLHITSPASVSNMEDVDNYQNGKHNQTLEYGNQHFTQDYQ